MAFNNGVEALVTHATFLPPLVRGNVPRQSTGCDSAQPTVLDLVRARAQWTTHLDPAALRVVFNGRTIPLEVGSLYQRREQARNFGQPPPQPFPVGSCDSTPFERGVVTFERVFARKGGMPCVVKPCC